MMILFPNLLMLKKALGDVKQFTVKDELNSEGIKDLIIVIGDGNGYANKIKFKTTCESNVLDLK